MKNKFFRSEHTSSQIWCFLKFPLLGGGGGGGQKIKVAQNGVKHGLVLESLRSDEIFEIWSEKLTGQQASNQASKHTSGHHSDQISRSALRDGATNKVALLEYNNLWRMLGHNNHLNEPTSLTERT